MADSQDEEIGLLLLLQFFNIFLVREMFTHKVITNRTLHSSDFYFFFCFYRFILNAEKFDF